MIWPFLMMLWILRLTCHPLRCRAKIQLCEDSLNSTEDSLTVKNSIYWDTQWGNGQQMHTLWLCISQGQSYMRNHMWKHTKVLKPTNAIFWGIQTEEVNDDTQQRKALESTFNWIFHYRRKQKYLNIFCISMGKWGKILCKLLRMKSQKSCGTTSVAKWIQWWRKFCCNILESESAVLQWRQSGLKEVQQRHESLLSPPGHLAQFQTNDQIM